MAFLTENGNIKSSMSVDGLWIIGELPTPSDSTVLSEFNISTHRV